MVGIKRIIVSTFIIYLLTSCNTIGLYEKLESFPKHEWKGNDTTKFTFQINDTTHLYRMYLVVRHTEAYHFRNIWVNINAVCPDTTFTITREFKLADNEKWLGSGMGDIYEHRMPFSQFAHPLKSGTYTFNVQQVMREDPLKSIANAGIRLERIK